eukprot:5723958-Pyramimonas_sp.AAC.1
MPGRHTVPFASNSLRKSADMAWNIASTPTCVEPVVAATLRHNSCGARQEWAFIFQTCASDLPRGPLFVFGVSSLAGRREG